MTAEDLKTVYERAKQYVIAKHNDEPISIEIEEDGSLSAEYLSQRGRCGDPNEYSHYYFSLEDLTSDLDTLVIERKKKEEEQAIKAKKEQEIRQEEYDRKQKEYRKTEYLKLKKEFEL